LLIGARVATERQCNDGGEWWWCELNVGVEEGKSELESEERMCSFLWGSALPFIGTGEAVVGQ
jgi:hypothetical protein